MATMKIDGGDRIEIIGESFVCLSYSKPNVGDLHVEFSDLPLSERESILSIRNQILSLREELADHLLTLSRKNAA